MRPLAFPLCIQFTHCIVEGTFQHCNFLHTGLGILPFSFIQNAVIWSYSVFQCVMIFLISSVCICTDIWSSNWFCLSFSSFWISAPTWILCWPSSPSDQDFLWFWSPCCWAGSLCCTCKTVWQIEKYMRYCPIVNLDVHKKTGNLSPLSYLLIQLNVLFQSPERKCKGKYICVYLTECEKLIYSCTYCLTAPNDNHCTAQCMFMEHLSLL